MTAAAKRVAVVAGYDGEDVGIELVDLSKSLSVQANAFKATWGTPLLQSLYINKSGQYEIRLMADGVGQGSFMFWVTRNSSGVLSTFQRFK